MRRIANKYWKQTSLLGDIIAMLLTRTIAYRVLSWATGTVVSGAKMYFIPFSATVTKVSVKETLYYEGNLV